jgi:hypothetical protein
MSGDGEKYIDFLLIVSLYPVNFPFPSHYRQSSKLPKYMFASLCSSKKWRMYFQISFWKSIMMIYTHNPLLALLGNSKVMLIASSFLLLQIILQRISRSIFIWDLWENLEMERILVILLLLMNWSTSLYKCQCFIFSLPKIIC